MFVCAHLYACEKRDKRKMLGVTGFVKVGIGGMAQWYRVRHALPAPQSPIPEDPS